MLGLTFILNLQWLGDIYWVM